MYNVLFEAIENKKDLILEAERYIWKHPEIGFREWNTHKYLKGLYEELGYTVNEAGDIPGFYIDIDTGRPGPCIGVFGEMDGLTIPEHPEADKETGAVHACGHNTQCAALLGVAIALKAKNALDGMCGRIRLFAVPAEEMVDCRFGKELVDKGILHFYGGKQEFIYRRYLDDVDMAIMVHIIGKGFAINSGCNGYLKKEFTFIGKSTHAAGPFGAKNALYAANNAIANTNALRETFSEQNKVRFHSIITSGGEAVNVIPSLVKVESAVRGLTMKAILTTNKKINLAFAAGAMSMGCRLIINDSIGYLPRKEDKNLQNAFLAVARTLFDESEIKKNPSSAGCTDMGDVSAIMPVCHAFIGGSVGSSHTEGVRITDPELACVKNAKLQAGVLSYLLSNNAAEAQKVIDEADVLYSSTDEYIEAMSKIAFNEEAVIYNDDGSVIVRVCDEETIPK